jgi:hypothetical protein
MYIEDRISITKNCPRKFGSKLHGYDNGCEGSSCAVWRWKPELNPKWNPKDDLRVVEEENDYRLNPHQYVDSKTHGYCGLATRPSFEF